MLNFKGHLGVDAKPGDFPFAVPATPTDAFVGGMPAKLNTSGELAPATAYNTANPSIVGLFRYSEATFIRDLNGASVQPRATIVRNALGVGIGKGKDTQTGIVDAMSPYDTSKTYVVNNPLYVNSTTGQVTNASADAGTGPKVFGKVLTIPEDAASGTEMIIQIFGDLA